MYLSNETTFQNGKKSTHQLHIKYILYIHTVKHLLLYAIKGLNQRFHNQRIKQIIICGHPQYSILFIIRARNIHTKPFGKISL